MGQVVSKLESDSEVMLLIVGMVERYHIGVPGRLRVHTSEPRPMLTPVGARIDGEICSIAGGAVHGCAKE